jgi:hypothetical protein
MCLLLRTDFSAFSTSFQIPSLQQRHYDPIGWSSVSQARRVGLVGKTRIHNSDWKTYKENKTQMRG